MSTKDGCQAEILKSSIVCLMSYFRKKMLERKLRPSAYCAKCFKLIVLISTEEQWTQISMEENKEQRKNKAFTFHSNNTVSASTMRTQ